MKDDPVRRRVIEGLARRAAAQQGETRERLLQRVQALSAAMAAPAAGKAEPVAAPGGALAALRALVDRLGRTPKGPATALRSTWTRLRVEQRVRQALDQVPANAGPLNSSYVVHRALHAMREISPAYLDAFMSHVDTLRWLEEAAGGELERHRASRRRTREG
jgi:hypothetical protein